MLRKQLNFIGLAILCSMPLMALASTYPMPKTGNDIIGEVFTAKAQAGDTIGSLGLRNGMSLHEMMEANPGIGMNAHLRNGQKLVVPAQFILPKYRQGIVINMAELRLYYFTPDNKYVMTFPVAMGRDQWRSPTIQTRVLNKEINPSWYVPKSIQDYTFENSGKELPDVVPPGPDNPLGPYALKLAEPGYLIHGNNVSSSIGKFVSSGCIRMKNADIKTLFDSVKVGTTVRIVHYPNKIGWFNGVLYQESQLPVALNEEQNDLNQTSLTEAVTQGVGDKTANINWDAAAKIAKQHVGIPEPIGSALSANNQPLESHPPLPLANNNNDSDSDLISPSSSPATHFPASTNVATHDQYLDNDENSFIDNNWDTEP